MIPNCNTLACKSEVVHSFVNPDIRAFGANCPTTSSTGPQEWALQLQVGLQAWLPPGQQVWLHSWVRVWHQVWQFLDQTWLRLYGLNAQSYQHPASGLHVHCRFVAYVGFTLVLSTFVYPMVVHWVHSDTGFLSRTNPNALMVLLDFAGCSNVHITGGFASLIGAYVAGPRPGVFLEIPEVTVQRDPGLTERVRATQLLWQVLPLSPTYTLPTTPYRLEVRLHNQVRLNRKRQWANLHHFFPWEVSVALKPIYGLGPPN